MFSWFKKKTIDDGIPLDLDVEDERPPQLPDEECTWLADRDDYSEIVGRIGVRFQTS
jgi:hypothetical protein